MYGAHRDLHVLTPSFPTRRSFDLYAVYVDEADKVWVTDFGANAVLRFDPETERFESFPSDRRNAAVRQMLGREGEVWAPESRSEEHTSELQSLMRISYAVFCLKKKKKCNKHKHNDRSKTRT